MDITQLNIGTPILIKTSDDIYESYISAITLSDENFVYFKSGSIRTTLLDKLKSNSSQHVGNKLDLSGRKNYRKFKYKWSVKSKQQKSYNY